MNTQKRNQAFLTRGLLFLTLYTLMHPTFSASTPYGEILCKQPEYLCHDVERREHWSTLFPDPEKRELVRRINRMNGFLRAGMRIAIPKDLDSLTLENASPLPQRIPEIREKTVVVHLGLSAFGAYDANGRLVRWGPLSAGTVLCPETGHGCSTPTGSYRVLRKGGADCISHTYPASVDGRNGGGEMPWCIFFHKGYALHGSAEIPGYPSSHGCVRLFIEDAEWLNRYFVETQSRGRRATRILIGERLSGNGLRAERMR
ncbi:L,D-transpeptidase [Legionella geestiana]|nr:L,D-transpeptidase [Legionella geestiana]